MKIDVADNIIFRLRRTERCTRFFIHVLKCGEYLWPLLTN